LERVTTPQDKYQEANLPRTHLFSVEKATVVSVVVFLTMK
jgi:hypothetical protein